MYSSVATSSVIDGEIPFLLQEHQVGHCGHSILSADILWVVWIQGFHCDQLAHLFLNSDDSAFTKALQTLLHFILSHDNLRDRVELLFHEVLEK